MATTNIMKATWPIFYDLQDKNLTMFAQYTAAPWEYIGTQGVIQGTFETLAAIGEQHFGGSLVGRILFTAGLGGMETNQPRAMTMHGGVCLVVGANPDIIPAHPKKFLDVQVNTLEEGIALAEKAKAEGRALGIGLHGNAAEIFPAHSSSAGSRTSSPRCARATTRSPTSPRGTRWNPRRSRATRTAWPTWRRRAGR